MGVQQAAMAVMSVLTQDEFYLDGTYFAVPSLDFYKPFFVHESANVQLPSVSIV